MRRHIVTEDNRQMNNNVNEEPLPHKLAKMMTNVIERFYNFYYALKWYKFTELLSLVQKTVNLYRNDSSTFYLFYMFFFSCPTVNKKATNCMLYNFKYIVGQITLLEKRNVNVARK